MTGQLWESEHGPTGGDEINIIEPNKNYGWGVITMGVQNGITKRSEPGMQQPVRYWTPSVAPSGIAFSTGTRYPGWKNNLFVGCLVGQQLKRLEIANGKVDARGAGVQPVRPRPRRRAGAGRSPLRHAAVARTGALAVDARNDREAGACDAVAPRPSIERSVGRSPDGML